MIVRGQIKVDAQMAAAKIRDHLLSDLDLYATEVARAAAAFGATWLDVTWDLDDVVLTFDGRGPPAAELARARDAVLGGANDENAAGLRLLGIGISAALGLDPAFVDVLVAGAEGVECVRFERDAERLSRDEAKGLPLGCMRLLVRRKLGLDVLRSAARSDPPRAVRHVLERAWPSPLRITMHGAPIAAGVEPLVVVAPPASPFRVRLELLPAQLRRGHTVFVERGFALVGYDFVGGPADVDTEHLPIRVVIEADRLPTNASRSAIRLETPALVALFARLGPAFDQLLRDAAARRGEPAVREALGALAAWVFRRQQDGHVASGPFAALLDLPLLRDAFGRDLALRALVGVRFDHPVLVHEGDAPLEPALAPMFPATVWRRGRAVERALARVPTARADEPVGLARIGWRKRQRALARVPALPTVPPAPHQLYRERFEVTEGSFAGLRGELAVGAGTAPALACTVHWFLDGQRFEVTQERRLTFFVLELALAWDGQLQTDLSYEHLQSTSRRAAAIAYAHCVAAVVLLERSPEPGFGKAAIRTWLHAAQELGVRIAAATLPEALTAAAIWSCSDGRLVSLGTLRAEVERIGAICTSPLPTPAAPDGRPVLLEAEGELLLRLLPGVALARYGRWLDGHYALPSPEPRAAVPFEREHTAGYLTPGTGQIQVYHAGKLLLTKSYRSRFGPVDIVVDAKAVAPKEGTGFFGRLALGQFRTLERQLLEHVIDATLQGAFDAHVPAPVQAYVAEAERVESARLLAARSSPGGAPRTLQARVERLRSAHDRVRQTESSNLRSTFLAAPVLAPAPVVPREAYVLSETPGTGTVAVTLRPAGVPRPVGLVLFQGRKLMEQPPTELPITAVADVAREDFVNGTWTGLTTEGAAWVRKASVAAAFELLRRRLELPHVLDDEATLCLAAALCAESRAKVAEWFAATAWPTIDGGARPLPEGSPVRVGSHAYDPYLRGQSPSPLDEPVLLVPDAAPGRRLLLLALGYTLDDVTAVMARVQKSRAASAGDAVRYTDTMGRRHTLAELIAAHDLLVTTSPEHDGLALEVDDRPVLRVEPAAVPGLRSWLQDSRSGRQLRDVTAQLDQERRGAERRSAPALERIELTPQMRACCSHVVRFTWKADGLRGELGVLRPEHAGQRGLWLYARKKPLARLDDAAGGPPTLARIDVGKMATNTAFDGLLRFDDEERIRRAIAHAVRLETRVPAAPPPLPAPGAPPPLPAPGAPPPLPVAPRVTVGPSVLETEAPQSFWAYLWRTALTLAQPVPVPAEPAALAPLAERLDACRLAGAPVATVSATHVGRPVCFHAGAKSLRVNVRHASVAKLVASGDSMHLALAALSEINRELATVTEADERELVRELLAGLATEPK